MAKDTGVVNIVHKRKNKVGVFCVTEITFDLTYIFKLEGTCEHALSEICDLSVGHELSF